MRLLMQVLSSSSVFFSVGLGMDNDVQFDPGKHRTFGNERDLAD